MRSVTVSAKQFDIPAPDNADSVLGLAVVIQDTGSLITDI